MLDDIIKACRNPKIQVVTPIVVFVAVLLLMLASFDYSIAPYIVYPEEEYQLLEEEAEKMLAQDGFDSQYVDTIEYEAKSDILRVKLNTTNATLQMNFSDYGEEKESVEVERLMSKGIFLILGITLVIGHYLLYSIFFLLLAMLAFKLLEHVCLKIQRRRENQTNI
ncbi:MAG: hypothetical protein IKK43_06625 [Clostridia bacterium]|nr:hypothetical protein [Clostridia bacterium]